ncbi:hypothetical protein ACHHYP_12758 [Achlya hypogyna]|uniref:Ribosome assembly protein 3 n=1 Tax=Achlya hypogyna TaxID=1202772 RepID=A0A1V9ZGE5_ACHHY|nr:hypothetical protein ACHHYP_12758 [Achlya hypogyna]
MTGYAELIAALGEKPLEKTSTLESLEAPADLDEATDKTLQCAELLSSALLMAHALAGDSAAAVSYDAIVKEIIAMDGSVKDIAKKHSATLADGLKASRGLLHGAEASLDALETTEEQEARFHELYTESFASAFGDELDKLRQDDAFEAKDVSYLITCIKAGGDVFSPLEKSLFIATQH